MANTLYDYGRKRLLEGDLDWPNATINCVLVDSANFTPNFAESGSQFYSAISGGSGLVAGPQTLSSPAIVNGAADAGDVTFANVTGASIEFIILYVVVTDASDSWLLVHIDTATGLPITPNSGDIIVTWDNGANRVFKP